MDYNLQKIEEIKKLNTMFNFVEVGAGCPIYNELCQYANTASKIVLKVESPNNWEWNKSKFSHAKDVRAVSREVCANFISASNIYDTQTFVNTIQISNDPSVCTHGWFGLTSKEGTKYYHFTINTYFPRKKQIAIIASIGLDILACNNDASKLDNGYIDDIYYNSESDHYDVLKSLYNSDLAKDNNHNTSIVFRQNGKLDRLNDLLREVDKDIIVFKGSFNPIHPIHLRKMKVVESMYTNAKAVFAISMQNRDTNKTIDLNNLMKRIKLIHSFGYDVIVDSIGFYKDSYYSIAGNTDFKDDMKIHYVMGGDIIKRFLEDESVYGQKDIESDTYYFNSIKLFNAIFSKSEFLYFDREDIEITIDDQIKSKVKKIEDDKISMSSTEIRQHIENSTLHESGLESEYLNKLQTHFL